MMDYVTINYLAKDRYQEQLREAEARRHMRLVEARQSKDRSNLLAGFGSMLIAAGTFLVRRGTPGYAYGER